MSWDVIVFNSAQKINSIEEIDETLFIPIDFYYVIQKHFKNIFTEKDSYCEIKGNNYSIVFFAGKELTANIIFNLYGRDGLFELIKLAKIYNWQIYDTGKGEMINLQHPEENGHENFQNYLQSILNNNKTS